MSHIQTLRDWLAENDVDLDGDDRNDWIYLADSMMSQGYVIPGDRNGVQWEIYVGDDTGVTFVLQSDPTGTRMTEQNFSVTDYPGVVHLQESTGDNIDLFDRISAAVGNTCPWEEGEEDGQLVYRESVIRQLRSDTRLELG